MGEPVKAKRPAPPAELLEKIAIRLFVWRSYRPERFWHEGLDEETKAYYLKDAHTFYCFMKDLLNE